MRNGSVPQTPARTGVLLHDRQHFAGHVDDDLVGVAIGHHAAEAAAARHAKPARVVDDDEIDAAGLGALGADAGAGAAADDRLARREPGSGGERDTAARVKKLMAFSFGLRSVRTSADCSVRNQ